MDIPLLSYMNPIESQTTSTIKKRVKIFCINIFILYIHFFRLMQRPNTSNYYFFFLFYLT